MADNNGGVRELSTVSLFWRDEIACCFTSFRFYEPIDPVARAKNFARCLASLSQLQLYCVIVNQQIIDWQPQQPAPPSGTARRVEITLYPEEPLNPRAGITLFKITISGPKPATSENRLTCQLLTSLLANVGTRGHTLVAPA